MKGLYGVLQFTNVFGRPSRRSRMIFIHPQCTFTIQIKAYIGIKVKYIRFYNLSIKNRAFWEIVFFNILKQGLV